MRRLLTNLAQIATGLGLSLGLLSIKIFPRSFFLATARVAADLGFVLFHSFRTRSIRNLTLALGDQLGAAEIAATVRRSLRRPCWPTSWLILVERPASITKGNRWGITPMSST